MNKSTIDFNALNATDWDFLGGQIEKCLPANYSRKDEAVKIYKRRDGEFGADMSFVSTVTGSSRIVRFYQTGVSVYANGCPIGRGNSGENAIEQVWAQFKSDKVSLFERGI